MRDSVVSNDAESPTTDRFEFGGRLWPNTEQGWHASFIATHDCDFPFSEAELEESEAYAAWLAAQKLP